MQTRRVAMLASGLVMIVGCSGNQARVVESWRAPGTVQVAFDKVLAVAFTADGELRRAAENEMVRQIKGAEAVASYTLLGDEEQSDSEKAQARMREAGFDGVVTLKVVGVDEQLYAGAGAAEPFWGYYNDTWPAVYDPGYLRADTVVRIETGLYSLRDDKLIWKAVTQSFNPDGAAELVDDVARAVGRELRKQKLVE